MDNLKTTTILVKDILRTDAISRNSDDYLYLRVCERINADGINLPFRDVIKRRRDLNYPAFETVRRTRQKVQEHHPELAAVPDVEAMRMVNEEEYRAYARKVNV